MGTTVMLAATVMLGGKAACSSKLFNSFLGVSLTASLRAGEGWGHQVLLPYQP